MGRDREMLRVILKEIKALSRGWHMRPKLVEADKYLIRDQLEDLIEWAYQESRHLADGPSSVGRKFEAEMERLSVETFDGKTAQELRC